jgi:hypothetical protein
MGTVYVVEAGDYPSEAYIAGIYSTKELADRAAAVHRGSVRDYELDADVADLPTGDFVWRAVFNRDGDLRCADPYGLALPPQHIEVPPNDGTRYGWSMVVYVLAPDEPRARELARARRAAWPAEGEGAT